MMNDAHGIDGQKDYNKSIVPLSKPKKSQFRGEGEDVLIREFTWEIAGIVGYAL